MTGASGFTATHLLPLLPSRPQQKIFLTDVKKTTGQNSFCCNLSRKAEVNRLIETTRPDQIYHLAGAFSNTYEKDYRANVLSTKNILDACLKLSLKCRILLIGSSAEYGNVSENDNPVREDQPLNPVSIYGLTKSFQTGLMHYYHNVFSLNIVMARMFNILGQGIPNSLFIGRVYELINEYKEGSISKISLGNLQHRRDYLDVREAVKDYKCIMEHGISGEIYNVGSGKSMRTYDLLKQILNDNNISIDIVEEKVSIDPCRIDIKNMYADRSKLDALREYCLW